MNFLVDMNLSPEWEDVFKRHGWSAVHWSAVGNPRAADRVVMDWARENQSIVFTHDLDFGMLLALTNAEGPSVIQVRVQNITPEHLEAIVVAAIQQHETLLEAGALIVIDESTSRARVLPLNR